MLARMPRSSSSPWGQGPKPTSELTWPTSPRSTKRAPHCSASRRDQAICAQGDGTAGSQDSRERQRVGRGRPEAGDRRTVGCGVVYRAGPPTARTDLGVVPVSPMGDGVTAEAVCDQYDRSGGPLDRVMQFGHPLVPVRPFPVPLLDPNGAAPVPEPVGLSVTTPGTTQARHGDHVLHGRHLVPRDLFACEAALSMASRTSSCSGAIRLRRQDVS